MYNIFCGYGAPKNSKNFWSPRKPLIFVASKAMLSTAQIGAVKNAMHFLRIKNRRFFNDLQAMLCKHRKSFKIRRILGLKNKAHKYSVFVGSKIHIFESFSCFDFRKQQKTLVFCMFLKIKSDTFHNLKIRPSNTECLGRQNSVKNL
jgi:hypothetical protein